MPHEPAASAERKPRVLVAEDEFLLAALMEENLQEYGYEMVGPFADLQSLIAGVAAAEFDIAVLDVNLNGERVYPVALSLLDRHIPFILLTGYGVGSLPRELQAASIVAKPYSFNVVDSEIQRLMALHRAAPLSSQ